MNDVAGASPFPDGFFERADPSPDSHFYGPPRLVTHIDQSATASVGGLYTELGLAEGSVLDLMSSWISHFQTKPKQLTVLGMNKDELEANPMADRVVVGDLNLDPVVPFADDSFDGVVCCVSVDYLTRPIEVFTEVRRVLRPGAPFVCTFSNRCFPTKAIRGWLATDDQGHARIVATYFEVSGGWTAPNIDVRIPPGTGTDPLIAVWARNESPSKR